LRKIILKTCKIDEILDLSRFKIFQDAIVRNTILISKKEDDKSLKNQNKIKIIIQKTEPSLTGINTDKKLISQTVFLKTPENMFRLELDDIYWPYY
jgi:hypothetical protein